jgi:spore maturation protein CgeB
MRIALHVEYYPEYIRHFYHNVVPDHVEFSFDALRDRLVDDYFSTWGSYYKHLKAMGHDVFLIVSNNYNLQQKWIDEQGCTLTVNRDAQREVVLLQIKNFEPDVYCVSSIFHYFNPEYFQTVKELVPRIFCWISCQYPQNLYFDKDVCYLSCFKHYVQQFKEQGLKAEYLKVAFNKDILEKIHHGHDSTRSSVGFIGSLRRKSHGKRIDMLEYLLEHAIDCKIWGDAIAESESTVIKKIAKGPLWGRNYFKILSQLGISLNFHTACTAGCGLNIRNYESTGCGALLMAEDTPILREEFIPGKEVIAYTDKEDLLEKVRHYLNNPDEAHAIALNGQRKTFELHNYEVRAKELIQIFEKH